METPPLDSAATGIARGVDTVVDASAKIASADQMHGNDDRTVEALVELEQGKQQAQASAKALSAENDVIGALLSDVSKDNIDEDEQVEMFQMEKLPLREGCLHVAFRFYKTRWVFRYRCWDEREYWGLARV